MEEEEEDITIQIESNRSETTTEIGGTIVLFVMRGPIEVDLPIQESAGRLAIEGAEGPPHHLHQAIEVVAGALTISEDSTEVAVVLRNHTIGQ